MPQHGIAVLIFGRRLNIPSSCKRARQWKPREIYVCFILFRSSLKVFRFPMMSLAKLVWNSKSLIVSFSSIVTANWPASKTSMRKLLKGLVLELCWRKLKPQEGWFVVTPAFSCKLRPYAKLRVAKSLRLIHCRVSPLVADHWRISQKICRYSHSPYSLKVFSFLMRAMATCCFHWLAWNWELLQDAQLLACAHVGWGNSSRVSSQVFLL